MIKHNVHQIIIKIFTPTQYYQIQANVIIISHGSEHACSVDWSFET